MRHLARNGHLNPELKPLIAESFEMKSGDEESCVRVQIPQCWPWVKKWSFSFDKVLWEELEEIGSLSYCWNKWFLSRGDFAWSRLRRIVWKIPKWSVFLLGFRATERRICSFFEAFIRVINGVPKPRVKCSSLASGPHWSGMFQRRNIKGPLVFKITRPSAAKILSSLNLNFQLLPLCLVETSRLSQTGSTLAHSHFEIFLRGSLLPSERLFQLLFFRWLFRWALLCFQSIRLNALENTRYSFIVCNLLQTKLINWI